MEEEDATPPIEDYATGPYQTMINEQVPDAWHKSCNALLKLWTEIPEHLYNDPVMKINDRFVIAGARNLTWKFVYGLVELCRSYEFNECYVDDVTGLNMRHKMDALLNLEKRDEKNKEKYKSVSEEYAWNLSEELTAMWDKKPTPEHAGRLNALAESCGVSFGIAWANDYDIRMRKEIPYGHPDTVTNAFGREYLFFVIIDPNEPPEARKFKCMWMEVGAKCAQRNCGLRTAANKHCGRCKKAKYCCPQHQIEDWNDKHRLLCKAREGDKK